MNKRNKNKKRMCLKTTKKIVFVVIFIPIISIIISEFMFSKFNVGITNDVVSVISQKNEINSKITSVLPYTIQVASISDYDKVKLITSDLDENQIPNHVKKIDNIYKIYSYTFFDENQIRTFLDGVRETYKDAFIVKDNIPSVKFEYTSKYKDVEKLVCFINEFVNNLKKESDFWYSYNIGHSNYNEYISIINERNKMVDSLTKFDIKPEDEILNEFKKSIDEFFKNEKLNLNEINYNLSQNNMYYCQKYYLKTVYDYKNTIEGVGK